MTTTETTNYINSFLPPFLSPFFSFLPPFPFVPSFLPPLLPSFLISVPTAQYSQPQHYRPFAGGEGPSRAPRKYSGVPGHWAPMAPSEFDNTNVSRSREIHQPKPPQLRSAVAASATYDLCSRFLILPRAPPPPCQCEMMAPPTVLGSDSPATVLHPVHQQEWRRNRTINSKRNDQPLF